MNFLFYSKHVFCRIKVRKLHHSFAGSHKTVQLYNCFQGKIVPFFITRYIYADWIYYKIHAVEYDVHNTDHLFIEAYKNSYTNLHQTI